MENIYELLLKLRKRRLEFGVSEENLQRVLSKYRFEINSLDTREAIRQDLLMLSGGNISIYDDTTSEEIGKGRVSFLLMNEATTKRISI
jgi:hypothetical protein